VKMQPEHKMVIGLGVAVCGAWFCLGAIVAWVLVTTEGMP